MTEEVRRLEFEGSVGFFKAKIVLRLEKPKDRSLRFSDECGLLCKDTRSHTVIRNILKALKHWANDTPTDSLIQIRSVCLLLLSVAYYAPIAISFVYGLWLYAWLILIVPVALRGVMIWGPIVVLGLAVGVVNPKARC